VTEVQYTYTHKQCTEQRNEYREQHNEIGRTTQWNTQNNAMKYAEQRNEIRRRTEWNTQNNTMKYAEKHN